MHTIYMTLKQTYVMLINKHLTLIKALAHLFPLHPIFTKWTYKQTLPFSDVLGGKEIIYWEHMGHIKYMITSKFKGDTNWLIGVDGLDENRMTGVSCSL